MPTSDNDSYVSDGQTSDGADSIDYVSPISVPANVNKMSHADVVVVSPSFDLY
jgi:hypothetical protein